MRDFAPFIDAMVTPGKQLGDVLKAMPPETLGKLAAKQKSDAEHMTTDWANLCRYAGENEAVLASGVQPRVVFLGDSITEFWKLADPELFTATVLDRGISGQTTPQILLRFYQDVVALHPRVVHIMAGTNDVAGNTGPTSDSAILNNLCAMIKLAKANHIRVVLASIPPAKVFGWQPALHPAERIVGLNRQLAAMAREEQVVFADYHGRLADPDGGFAATLANDGVHPNQNGYAVMKPLAMQAIAEAEKQSEP